MSSDAKNIIPPGGGGDGPLQQKAPASNQRPTRRQMSSGYQGSGMTPSIISTINNTDPHNPAANYPSIVNNNNGQSMANKNRRTNEPYESYIEDSFVGHWEHEDDEDDYQEDFDSESLGRGEDGDRANLQHPSTIEFDFDSFGPESFIYTPTTTTLSTNPTIEINEQPQTASNTSELVSPDSLLSNTTSTTTRQPALIEVSSELEKRAEDEQNREVLENDYHIQQLQQQQQQQPIVSTESNNNEQAQQIRLGRSDSNDSRDSQIAHHQFRNFKPQYDLVDPTQIDMKVIEPYKKVISHAGYCHHFDSTDPAPKPNEPTPAVIVFSACYLPDRSRRDYNYVMDHLFLYVLTSLHELIADDYILIYLHNTQPGGQTGTATSSNSAHQSSVLRLTSSNNSATTSTGNQHQNNLPTFSWMKRCYQMIDRRLRKNLRILYLVKPTFWLKTVVIMCKPFISAKFSKKLRFVDDMNGLKQCLPVDKLILPASADYI